MIPGENAIWHVFQTAVLDDVNIDQRLAIEFQLILNDVILCRHILCTLPYIPPYHCSHNLNQNENVG